MSTFASVIEQFGGSGDLPEAQREAVSAVAQLADAKNRLFYDRITASVSDTGGGVPINQVVRTDGLTRAFTAASADDIPAVVESTITACLDAQTDDILRGVFDVVIATLERFLGTASGSDDSIQTYFLYPADFAIYRLDLSAWSRSTTAQSLKAAMRQATAYACVLSTVAVDRITLTNLLMVFSGQLDLMPNLTSAQRDAAKTRMRNTYNFLTGNDEAQASMATPIDAGDFLPLVPIIVSGPDEGI